MKKLITNLIYFAIIFALSGFFAGIFGVDHFLMYFRIDIGISIIVFAIMLILLAAIIVASDNAFVRTIASITGIKALAMFVIATVVTLIVASVFAKTFSLDFYVVYTVMQLGRLTRLGSDTSDSQKKNK